MKRTALAFALAAAFEAPAVTLNPEGLGQALIYPYYTVRSIQGTTFNTYLSVANHSAQAKALRVRVREGRNAREVASLNLYLSPNDAWTAAIAPTGDGTRLLTVDNSCTDPLLATSNGVAALDFHDAAYSGNAVDGFGDTLDRTREGYIEVIEMATLTGASATAVTHNSAGVPANCAAIRGGTPLTAAPTGGLSGTLTLINVSSGMDFTLNAEALAELSSQPFFRAPADPYPGFAAAEIDPVSLVIANGMAYRSTWSRGVDAVSAVLMRSAWFGEYVLDAESASLTDFVLTQPLRHHYTSATDFRAPYTAAAAPGCQSPSGPLGEIANTTVFNREERTTVVEGCGFLCPPFGGNPRICAAAAVGAIRSASAPQTPADTSLSTVLGSRTLGLYMQTGFSVGPAFPNGWIASVVGGSQPGSPAGTLTSLATSTRMDLATGAVVTGAHTYSGLPLLGFAVRSFRNGTLSCAGGSCQGNYGGAFPFKYARQVSP